MSDYFSPRKRAPALVEDLLATHEHDVQLDFKQASTDPLYHSALALGTGFLSDVNLIVHEKQNQTEFKVFKCHKLILSLSSCVFHTMFHGSIPECHDVHIQDTSPTIFQVFLQFIYAGLFPTNLKLVDLFDSLYLARKYEICLLERDLTDQLGKRLKPATALSILKVALLYDLSELTKECWMRVDSDTCQVLSSDAEWLQLDRALLNLILKRQTLCIEEELLFSHALDWAKAECRRTGILHPEPVELRTALGSTLYLFAFPRMTATKFADGPAASGILSDSELVSIFMFICGSGVIKPDTLFATFKRRPGRSGCGNGSGQAGSAVDDCNCHLLNNNCFFCFGVAPYRRFKKEHSGCNKDMLAIFDRGLNLHQKCTKATTPPAYCACRTRNNCSGSSFNSTF